MSTTVKEAAALKAEAESTITHILENLANATGMNIHYIEVQKIFNDQGPVGMAGVTVELRL